MKASLFKIIFFICGVICCIRPSAAQETLPLDSLFARSAILQKNYYGFSLYDLDSNRSIYEHHADRLFTPASNAKIYTLYSVLQVIGDSIPGLHYIERGDSLIFWGTGDPTFLHPKLDNRRVYHFLKNSDKRLYYLIQENPDGSYRNGWAMEDYNYAYQAEVVPFPIYGNLVRFASDKGGLSAFPPYFDKTIAPLRKRTGDFFVKRHIGHNIFELFGNSVPSRYRTEKPFVWSDTLFIELLADTLGRSVELVNKDKYLFDSMYEEVRTIYSVPRDIVLREMMLPSDNFLAEQLTMVAAYSRYGSFLTDSLRKEMNDLFFSKFGEGSYLWDGSGLSTYNKVTPANTVGLLTSLYKQIGDDQALRMFFPAGGVDGTLKNAYRVDKSGPFVWAKTGTLRSVYCQSGYLRTKSGRNLTFSFLNNNFAGSATRIRSEVARLITLIHDNL